MPTALDLAANLTGASITEAQAKTWFTAMRAALAEIGDPMGRAGAVQNLSLAFSVGASALTCNVKTRAGGVPSATDPVSATMRNATLATGDFIVRNLAAALSLVISSGSTLGHSNATAGRIYWYLIDNAGTLELAASTTYFGVNGIITTTAEGGAGAADSATVMYSTTARANVPFICIGRTVDTQTTAGTWAAAPSSVELMPSDVEVISSMGTGSGRAAMVGVANINTTAVGNIGTGTDDLMTYSLPANSLSTDGKAVRVTMRGTTANNANAKDLIVIFGALNVGQYTLTISQPGRWEVVMLVVRIGSGTQDVSVGITEHVSGTLTAPKTAMTFTPTAGQGDTAAITIKAQAIATANNDVVQELMIVEFLN